MKPIEPSYLLPIISQDFRTSKTFVMDLFESQFLMDRLMQHGEDVSAAAVASGLTHGEFCQLLKKHRISEQEFAAARKLAETH